MFVKPVSVFLACSAQGRLQMHSRAPEPLSRNEISCTHCMRTWRSWLSVWKEEFLSNVTQQALLVSPKVSLHRIAGQAFSPPYLSSRRVWYESRLLSDWEVRIPQIWGQFCSIDWVGCAASSFGVGLVATLRCAFSAWEIEDVGRLTELAYDWRPTIFPWK